MSFTVIIPARLASTRLPNKPIADICGKPMIVRVAEQALKSGASRVICAVDDELILKACEANGIEACLTRKDHACGTDRLCEAAEVCKIPDDEIIVNVQGDEPLIPPKVIKNVAELLMNHSDCSMGTAAIRIHSAEEFFRSCSCESRCRQKRLGAVFQPRTDSLGSRRLRKRPQRAPEGSRPAPCRYL